MASAMSSSSTGSASPAYAGQFITLRLAQPTDYPTFLPWLASANGRQTGRPAPPEHALHAQVEAMLGQSLVLLASDVISAAPVGFVQAYNLNPTDGWCMARAYFEPARRGQQAATEAWFALIDIVLGSFGMQKLYIDIPDFNKGALERAFAGAFVEEGRFREHTRHDGRYWDVVRLAVYREAWPDLRERIWFLLGVGTEAAELLAEQRSREGAPVTP